MSGAIEKTKTTSFWIHTIITIAIMAGFGYLPPFGAVTPMGMKVLGVFLGMMYGWIAIELIWPSVIGLVFFGLSGFTTINGVFGTMLDAQVMQPFMCFLIAALFDKFGVTEYLAYKILSTKAVIGKPWVMVIVMFVAVAVISILASTTAAIFLMWAIIMRVADTVGCDKKDRFVSFMAAGCVYIGFNTSMILPFKATVVAYMSFVKGVMDVAIPFVPYIFWMVAFNLIVTAIYLLLGKFVFKLDTSKFKTDTDHFVYMRGAKATKNQKIGLVFIGIFIGVLMWPSIFPKTWVITQLFSNLGLIGVIAVLITAGAIMRDENGQAIAPISKLMSNIGWDIIWLLAATFPIAAAMRSADCGIMATVNAFVRPMVGELSPYILIIVFAITIGLLTQITHNVVLAAMFLPFLCPIVADMGGNPVVCWLIIFIACQSAYATPAASMCAAFVFGQESVAGTKNGYVYGFSMFLIMILTAFALMPIAIKLF